MIEPVSLAGWPSVPVVRFPVEIKIPAWVEPSRKTSLISCGVMTPEDAVEVARTQTCRLRFQPKTSQPGASKSDRVIVTPCGH